MNDITSRRRVAAPVALAIFVLVAAGLLSLGTKIASATGAATLRLEVMSFI